MRFLERRFFRRPRVLNLLHRLRVVNPTSQTVQTELDALAQYASGAQLAVEIGSYQGVSALCIAAAISQNGLVYCIDPWPAPPNKTNPCFAIFRRAVKRSGLQNKLKVITKTSRDASSSIPRDVDFIFVDGDHSWEGVESDWRLVCQKLRVGGVVCLHDSLTPRRELWRNPDSVRFYREVICNDPRFETIDTVYSLAVLKRTGL